MNDFDERFEELHLQSRIERIKRLEDAVKRKPTKKDVRETISLLRDFGITIRQSDILELKNVAELQRWRTSVIKQRLND